MLSIDRWCLYCFESKGGTEPSSIMWLPFIGARVDSLTIEWCYLQANEANRTKVFVANSPLMMFFKLCSAPLLLVNPLPEAF